MNRSLAVAVASLVLLATCTETGTTYAGYGDPTYDPFDYAFRDSIYDTHYYFGVGVDGDDFDDDWDDIDWDDIDRNEINIDGPDRPRPPAGSRPEPPSGGFDRPSRPSGGRDFGGRAGRR